MATPPTPRDELLREALENARALLADLRQQQAELLKQPPRLTPQRLEEGRVTLAAATQSDQRIVTELQLLVEVRQA